MVKRGITMFAGRVMLPKPFESPSRELLPVDPIEDAERGGGPLYDPFGRWTDVGKE